MKLDEKVQCSICRRRQHVYSRYDGINVLSEGNVSGKKIVLFDNEHERQEPIGQYGEVLFRKYYPEKDGGFSASDFEARGLFMGIITAVICAELYAFLLKHNIRIKMSKGIPDFVSDQFSAIIPEAIIIPIFLIVRLGFEASSYGTFTNFLIEIVQKTLVGVGSILIGTTIASFFNTFFWFFGFIEQQWCGGHGLIVVCRLIRKLEIFKQGSSLVRPFIGTMDYANFFI